jgi:hypothetical protein
MQIHATAFQTGRLELVQRINVASGQPSMVSFISFVDSWMKEHA